MLSANEAYERLSAKDFYGELVIAGPLPWTYQIPDSQKESKSSVLTILFAHKIQAE